MMTETITLFVTEHTETLLFAFMILSVFLLIVTIVLLVKVGKMEDKLSLFMRGSHSRNLEESLTETYEQVRNLAREEKFTKKTIEEIKKQVAKTYQRTAVVSYNAFPGMGGNSSTAIALLTQDLDGMVINIVHSRENCLTYVKTVAKGEAQTTLGEEEKAALNEALKEKPLEW